MLKSRSRETTDLDHRDRSTLESVLKEIKARTEHLDNFYLERTHCRIARDSGLVRIVGQSAIERRAWGSVGTGKASSAVVATQRHDYHGGLVLRNVVDEA